MTQTSNLEPKSRSILTPAFCLFIVGLFVCASVAFFFSYTNNISGTPDFFVEWTATRVSLEGKNPYSRETTELIQMGSKGRLVGPDEDQLAFATPYYRIFFNIPIAYLPYAVASAVWLGFMLALYIGAIYLITQAIGYRPTTPLEGTLLYLVAIFNFPVFSSLMLGQAALLSAAFLGWAYFGMKNNLALLAGIFTALATVKPQTAIGIVAFLGLYALWQRSWKFIIGFGATLLVLVVPSFLMFPSWLSQFLQGVGNYGSYKKSLTGPGFAFEWLGGFSIVPVIISFILLVGLGGWVVWQALKTTGLKEPSQTGLSRFDLAFSVMLVLTLLLPPQTNISNPAILFIPLILILNQLKGTIWFYVIAVGSIAVSWLIYFLLYNSWYGGVIILPPLLIGSFILFLVRDKQSTLWIEK